MLRAVPASHQLHCPSQALRRLWFERTTLQWFIRANDIAVIKTLFGAGLPHGPNVTSVVGVAYPTPHARVSCSRPTAEGLSRV